MTTFGNTSQIAAARLPGSGDAVLEGFHAIKHCLRFGGNPSLVISHKPEEIRGLAEQLAPDIADALLARLTIVSETEFANACPKAPSSPIAAIAPRRTVLLHDVLIADRRRPIVLLEDPRHAGNVGAVIRVAAGADAAAVITTGALDPWNASVLRGAAGLHYAIDVAHAPTIAKLPDAAHQLIALDPEGEPLDPRTIPFDAVLVFGTERQGISAELLARCERRVCLPMRAGVSSLNLATAVSATLFAMRFAQPVIEPVVLPGDHAHSISA